MTRAERIERALAAGLPASGLPGAAAAALTPEGEVVSLAVGRPALDSPEALAADAVFWIASMTKAVTSVAALQLVGEGRVGLDAPLDDWLPELADLQVLEGWDADGRARLRPARSPVTLRRLLSHTAGFGYNFASADLARWLAEGGHDGLGAGPPPGLPALFDPGARWEYGHNTDFVGRLVAAVEGRDLGAVLKARIFDPLGMADTGFTPDPARRVPMHARTAEGGLAAMPFAMPEPPYFQMGGAGLYGTASDYLRFLRAILGDGPALLQPEELALLTRPQLTEPRPGVLRSVAPTLANDFDAFPGQPTGWSLGFLVNLEPGPAGRSAGSLAWAGLSNCYFWADPDRRVAGVLLAQLLPFADPGALGLLDAFERAVYAP